MVSHLAPKLFYFLFANASVPRHWAARAGEAAGGAGMVHYLRTSNITLKRSDRSRGQKEDFHKEAKLALISALRTEISKKTAAFLVTDEPQSSFHKS